MFPPELLQTQNQHLNTSPWQFCCNSKPEIHCLPQLPWPTRTFSPVDNLTAVTVVCGHG